MSDYIKREDAEVLITNCANDGKVFEQMMLALADIPSADVVERESGEWVVSGMDRDGDYMGSRWYMCSQCGGPGDKGDNFCKRCGADMRSDKE